MQQAGAVMPQLSILLADNGIEWLLLQQGEQTAAFLTRVAVVVDPFSRDTLFGQFPGDGATEQWILFEQQYRHARVLSILHE